MVPEQSVMPLARGRHEVLKIAYHHEEAQSTSPFRKRGIQGDFACFLNPP